MLQNYLSESTKITAVPFPAEMWDGLVEFGIKWTRSDF